MNGYFVHFFAPRDILPLRKHVVFVLDTSGSMSGRRIAQLKEAMTYVLDDLKPDDYFNIIQFSHELKVRLQVEMPFSRQKHIYCGISQLPFAKLLIHSSQTKYVFKEVLEKSSEKNSFF